ncbi:uncharacterized protein K452DRAFT_335834 [Aplosporella prunicola CBS 121167]|uniref:Nephrocystin 3-like N-terminal domain-containing protein n=1 Tax=Aplosporella prunicola CBS 121167 TaxID=1176127 RepID=A0A6A6B709_9PEZI|nr:uncharacterized protein K452DRAFT_335834 [Aplosporella prunicola CBS 121167]KAF2139899.1 hypothetical protein K452DRAFT_335834 [Aplosporella prunicola CBS 121167]
MSEVPDTGISVVWEAPEGKSVVESVIHLLEIAHPNHSSAEQTWTQRTAQNPRSEPSSVGAKPRSRTQAKSTERVRYATSEDEVASDYETDKGHYQRPIFWPADLLPNDCPKARIITWGYDSKITNHFMDQTNKNNIFSHGKDLLFALDRERKIDKPLIFVAHSLGGIMALAISFQSSEKEISNFVNSTAAVVFLGTPQRGSANFANLGDIARKAASFVGMGTNPLILDSLGLKNSDLERCQDSFTNLWRILDFRVKTFQEPNAVTSVGVGLLNEKVVPNISSCLGDPREHAESIEANHMEMCRFSGTDDPNYRKVGGGGLERWPTFTAEEKACLQSLSFTELDTRYHTIDTPLAGTCDWLFELLEYKNWQSRENLNNHHGLLWIKGKPGSGKSKIIKEALHRLRLEAGEEEIYTASFFFNARGGELAKSPLGLYRSLVHQLLCQSPSQLSSFLGRYRRKSDTLGSDWEWHSTELEEVILNMFSNPRMDATTLFIDALDECADDKMRCVTGFLEKLTDHAFINGVPLNVCITSRDYPTVCLTFCSEIAMQDGNGTDIKLYVEQKLSKHDQSLQPLESAIIEKSAGVFLWVVLVRNVLEKQIRSLSKGLVEVKMHHHSVIQDSPLDETDSLHANPGSLFQDRDEDRIVQFIHESVREFFLNGDGFHVFGQQTKIDPTGTGHLTIMETCLDFIKITELDTFIQGHAEAKTSKSKTLRSILADSSGSLSSRSDDLSEASFATSASSSLYENKRATSIPQVKSAASSDLDYDLVDHDEISTSSAVPNSRHLGSKKKPAQGVQKINASSSISLKGSKPVSHDHANAESLEGESVLQNWLGDLESISSDMVHRTFSHQQSNTGHSEELKEYPQFLLYAENHLLDHAILATKFEIFVKKDNWKRWLALKENMPQDTTMLYHACTLNLFSWVEALLDMGENCNIEGGKLQFPLHVAVKLGQNQIISLLLEHGANVYSKDTKGRTAIHFAAASSNRSSVSKILNAMGRQGHFPNSDREKVVKSQRSKGIGSDGNYNIGGIPINYALNGNFMLRWPNVVSSLDTSLRTPLHFATQNSHAGALRELLRRGAYVNVQDKHGDTPLHLACRRDRPVLSVCEALLEAGGWFNNRNHKGDSPLTIAKKSGRDDLVQLITSHNNFLDSDSETEVFGRKK